jgi:type IV secretory pathway VirB6-like protein
LCSSDCYKKIVCSGTPSESNLFSRGPCVVSSEPETTGATCSANGPINNPANCTTCNEARRVAAELPYYISGNYDNCFDLEDYEGKIYNVIANASDESKINDLINNKKLKVLSGFNGLYGNFENYNVISSNNFETKYPITASVKGRMKFMIVDGYDLNIPNVAGASYTDFYDNNTGYATIAPSLSLTGRNGDWLQIKLCKESSSSSYDCKSLNMASANDLSNNNSPNPSIIQITPQSQIAFDSVNYAFDSSGKLFRNTDPVSGKDCSPATATSSVGGLAGGIIDSATSTVSQSLTETTNSILDPNSAVTTSKYSKFYCHTDKTSVANLRLSFKIFDPEVENCNLTNGSSTAPLNGVKVNNIKYSPGAGNDNQTCNQSESSSNSCNKQFSCVEKYSNNTGSYEVKIKVKNSRGISQIVNNIVQPIIYWMDGNSASSNPQERIGVVEKIYKSLISNSKYKLILKLSLVLFVMFYGLGYLMGVSELSQAEVITRVFKIGFIYLFVGENGWTWFKEIFVNIFKEGVMQASFLMASSFDSSTQLEDAIRTGNYSNTALLFGSVDKVISILFSSAINKKIWAFLFTGIFGWAYVLVFYFSILNYIYALSNAVLLFITAQIMISILFVVGPLFFIFLLFNQTKEMFDNWLKALVGFGLQLIFLITTLTFFNMLMVEVLKMALSYKVCWDDAWVINLGVRVTLTKFWTIPTLPPRTSMGEDLMNTGSPDAIPSFFSIIYIWVIASLTTRMVTFMTDAASTISDGIKASGMSGGIKQAAAYLKNGAAGLAKSQLWDTTVGRAMDSLDNKLFASGKTAKNERQANRRQASEDMAMRRDLGSAADKAEKDFKKNPDNIKGLADMTPEAQKDKIKQVRQEAMEKRGDKLGLDKEDVKRIASGHGLKYNGTNAFGAALQAMKQGMFKGGALVNPIKDKFDNQLSRKGAEKAIMNMNQQDREKFAKKVADGDINVKRNLKEKLFKDPLKTGKEQINSALRKLNHNFNPFNNDYKKAAKELQDEGKIMPDLINLGRSDKEKALIRERMNQNRDKAKRIGKKTVAKSLLKKGNANAKKKLAAQQDNLRKLLDENSDRPDLEELDDKMNEALDAIDNLDPNDSDNADQIDNANEVVDQFTKIDNLNDKEQVKNFLNQDNVQKINKNNDS